VSEGYGSHADFMALVREAADERHSYIDEQLRAAFQDHIARREVDVIIFDDVTIPEIATALLEHPTVLKPLIASCNIAGRAIARDLGLKNVNTYNPRLTSESAMGLAGYIKPFLPTYLELPALTHADRLEFIDKEMRAEKGRWETRVQEALNRFSREQFKKRKFLSSHEEFELDAAAPLTGPIEVGIDVKRIEARRDIHKRSDEVVNKATRFKREYPNGKFAAVIYYPFVAEHGNIRSRLESAHVDAVMFASEAPDSIEGTARLLLAQFDYVSGEDH
jgi:hypothetical protein